MTMFTTVLGWAAIGLIVGGQGHAAAGPSQAIAPTGAGATVRAGAPVSAERALLDRYCVTCHNERLKTAGLLLDKTDVEHVSASPEVWEKVLRKVRSATMPPAGLPRPDDAAYSRFAAYLETELDRSAAARPNPGRPAAVHRLNRAEYTNAIRDLLALEIDGRALLPPDDTGYGFDNIGDVLSVSPSLLERYLLAAQKIGRLAVGAPSVSPVAETFHVSSLLRQNERIGEDLPFGSRGGLAVRHHFPVDGEYVVKIRLQRTFLDVIRGMNEKNFLEVRLDKARIQLLTVGGKFANNPKASREERQQYTHDADSSLEVRFAAKAGPRLVGVTFVGDRVEPEGILEAPPAVASIDYARRDLDAAVDTIQIVGPYAAAGVGDTPSRRRIFICRPAQRADEDSCARKILSALARRAYRRPITEIDLRELLQFYASGRSQGDFETGIELALERILIDPEFLTRIERDPRNVPPGAAYRVSNVTLASRLSFFLWSSIPDDELLAAAERGELSDRTVLARQVRRMIRDPRSSALVSNFAGQWLYLRNMRAVAPDPEAFPEFDDNLRDAFQRETELFCESILREDRSVLDFLRADYTFVNERLARHYGLPNVYGSHFRRLTFSDHRRAGLLGQASILTVTSYPTRTSPVKRGKWLLENLLGAPPPPPPPNVPALKENNEGGKPTSVRERMEQHRRNPTCAGCHASMDPLGFALEHFDGIGQWRTTDGPSTIDPSGALPDGTKFRGSEELRGLLLSRGDEFVAAFTEKLLTYALGRGTEYYDSPAVRRIVRTTKGDDFRWSSIILEIVNSTPFQMRRARDSSTSGAPTGAPPER